MWNLQQIIFIWRRRYWESFKSALVYLWLNFQRTQYYPQDSDLFVYLSCQMCFLYWRVQIAGQQIPFSFSTLKTRKNDFQDLCKSNAQTINLSIAFILHFRLTATKSIVTEEWKIWKSTLRLYTVSEVSGLVIYHSLSSVVSWTCHHQRPKMHMMSILFYKDYIQISGG